MRAARVAALCALTVTLVAAPLSAAAFTPAVFMSMLATLVAAATAALNPAGGGPGASLVFNRTETSTWGEW